MRACFGVYARVGKAEAFHGTAIDQVLLHDLRGIFGLHVAIPNCLGIDDHRGTVFALVKAEGLIDANSVAEAGCFRQLLQLGVQLALAVSCARGPRSTFRTGVMADEDVVLERWQMVPPSPDYRFDGHLSVRQILHDELSTFHRS
jgi:hypothetical protein